MDKHWSHYCTMSIVHFMAFPLVLEDQGTIVDTISAIAEDDFFDAVEIAPIADPAIRQDVRRTLDIGQLEVAYCAHPPILSEGLDLNSLEESKRMLAVGRMEELIDQAEEVGASRFAFLSGPDPGEARREAAIEALIDSLNAMCAYGKQKGIDLALETFDRHVEKRALIGPVQDAARVANAISEQYPGFGLLYDLSHMPLLDETPSDMAVIREYLVHAHIGNCVKAQEEPLYGDRHPYIGVAGGVSGVEEVAAFIRGLFEIGYLADGKQPRPWVGIEVKPQGPGETPELIVANSKRVWRQAWFRA